MIYKVQFFRDGQPIGEAHWDKPLPEARLSAANVLTTHGADKAAILDMDDNNNLVATVSRGG